jgi:Tfp pilus assembly protein PilP
MRAVLAYPSKACPPAVPPPQPKTITLEPLGYVQKADGRVEAIISLQDRVHVVHEGETFEDNFKVAKISSSAVELVENSAPSAEPQLSREIGQGVAQAPECRVPQAPPQPASEVASNTDPHRQSAAGPAADGSQPSAGQELGYVERADGGVEAIVAEGEHVRLAPASKSFASNFHVPAPSPVSLAVANTLPLPGSPPDSVAYESQPIQANPAAQEVGETPLVASRTETSTLSEAQGVPQNNGDLESEPLGVIQPEPLADYSGSRLEPRDASLVPQAEPAGASPSPVTAAGSGQALKGGAAPHSSKGMGVQSEVNTLGYVEKAGGEKEAIVEVLGQVYLVREGELFAEKYRALQVTSSSVRIVEEPTDGSSLPSEIERDSGAVRPPISRWRAPPLPTGSSGTDLPMEVGKAKESTGGQPVVSPSMPPPEFPVESCEGPKEVQTPRAGPESVRPAQRPAPTDTRSPPCALNTVGFVEKATGETEAIVADEGGVYLVPGGRVSLDNPKITNLVLGLETSPLVIRTLTFPNLLSGIPARTFQTEAVQTRQ